MTQWLHVGDKRYQKWGMEDLDLEQLDRLEDELGLTLDRIADLVKEAALDDQRYFATRDRRRAIGAMVWAARTLNGENVAYVDAIRGIPVGSIYIEDDEPAPEVVGQDPTPPGSGAGSQ